MKKASARILSLALTLTILLGLLPGTALAAEPVQIGTAEELAAFRDRVNAGENTLDAVLTANIKLTGDWTPFNPASGFVTDAYAGIFDGDGHIIQGLAVQDESTAGVGLFGTVNGATIQNLQVEGAVSATNSAFVGGIVGKTAGNVTVENCAFSGSVTSAKTGSTAAVGGIVGRVNAGTVTLLNCANTATVSGGCAGGILGYCSSKDNRLENCCNTGIVTGSSRTGGITGQVHSNTTLTNCYTASGAVSGFNGVLTNCYDDATPLPGPAALGDAFTTDSEGNVILSWQAGEPPAPKDPHITVTGSSTLYMTNSGTQPTATLTAGYVDMDDTPAVAWSVVSGEDVVGLEAPENAGDNNASVIVRAKSPGYATVRAAAGDYSDQFDLTVWPFVTTVEIDGVVAEGNTVRAKVNVLGGGELDYDTFPVEVQWRSKASLTDAAFTDIPGAKGLSYTIPEGQAGGYLSFLIRYNGEDKFPGSPSRVLTAQEAKPTPEPVLPSQSIQEALEWYTMRPVYGRDTNVNSLLEAHLADHGLPGVTATVQAVEKVYGGGDVGENGDITYFYTDPNTTPAIHHASYKVTFTLTKGSESLAAEVPVIIPWDVDKVKAAMGKEILSQVELDISTPVTADLSLPKVVDGKRWTLISWQSSNPEVIAISGKNQTTADTLFDPYAGVVTPVETEQTVTLTATFTFQLTNDTIGQEDPIVLYKTFTLTVPALDEVQADAIRQELLAKLDRGFDAKGLTDAVTGARLEPDADGLYTAAGDIQLPTTRDFGVDGKEYPITITSSDETVIQAPDARNAARVEVLRPGVGQVDRESVITVTIADRDTGVTASRSFPVRVRALTQGEVDRELELMERVKAAYFEGIRGENTSKDDIRTDLIPFQEVYEGEDGELVWVRSHAERTGMGIVPTPIEGWEDLELWRLFKSSNPNVVSHEDLRVTRQSEAKAVTVTSYLSSETLGRYGALYQSDSVTYAQYTGLESLYYQKATTDAATATQGEATLLSLPDTMVVRGTSDPGSSLPVVETLEVSFVLTGLDGQVWIPATTYTGLDETFTVYDLFARALTDNGYTAVREKGTYLVSVSGAQGTLTEKEYGQRAGWMFRVNGVIPQTYMGACPLHDGDRVQVFYTRDASVDDPDWTWPSNQDTPAKPGHSSTPRPTTTKPAQTVDREPLNDQVQTPVSQLFADVAAGSWYESGVTFVVSRGLFQGVSDGHFAPETHLTRGMLMTVLARLDGQDTDGKEVWYQAGLNWAVEKGVSDGTAPDAPITREQLAAMLYRYAKALDLPTANQDSLSGFSDLAQLSDWARDAMAWAVDQGILTGKGGGLLDPQSQATRAEAAAMLQRFCQGKE